MSTSTKMKLFKCFNELEFDFEEFLVSKHPRINYQTYCLLINEIFGIGAGITRLHINGIFNEEMQTMGYEIAYDLGFYKDNSDDLVLSEQAKSILKIIRSIFKPKESDFIEVYGTYLYLLFKHDNIHKCEALKRTLEIKEFIIKDKPKYIKEVEEVHLQLVKRLKQIGTVIKDKTLRN